jgi:hypothetical protein
MCSAFSKSEGSNIDTSKKTKGIKKKDPKKWKGNTRRQQKTVGLVLD